MTNQEKAVEVFSRFCGRPSNNMSKKEYLSKIRTIAKRFGLNSQERAAALRDGFVVVISKLKTELEANHQRAVKALIDQSLIIQADPEDRDFFLDPERLSCPLNQLDRIFRTAIKKGRANGAAGQWGDEVAILECVSTLVKHAGGWENRTPELREFYSNLEYWFEGDNEVLHVRHAPSSGAVQ